MQPQKYPKVPPAKISSIDLNSFDGGLDQRGQANIKSNSFSIGRNAMVTPQGLVTHRLGLKRWLPDTVGTAYQVYPALYNGVVYYITADDGRIKYCVDGDTAWTNAGSADTAATYTTVFGTANSNIKYTAVQQGTLTNLARGALGNSVTIAYVNAGASKPLAVTVTGLAISVQLATNGSSVITSIASDIVTAINADVNAKKLVTAANAPANTGVGLVSALTATNLAGGVSGTNFVTTTVGSPNTFLRILDKVLILNGTDNLGYIDLSTLAVVHFNLVTNPTSAPTTAVVGAITGTTQKVYYCISYNSVVGKTISSPIVTQQLGKIREQWSTAGTEGVTVTDPNTRPAGAVSWNVYLATAAAGGTIQLTDMLPIALGLDISLTAFTDNGSIGQITNAGTAPTANSTQGAKAKYGVEIEGRPFLYGITGDTYAILIGGNDQYALDFTESNGGYRLVLNSGTDFLPSAIIGFRNGQGVPSITVLYSSVSGLSKASIIDQSTVSLGTFSATVWGSTDQNYGASGVSSPYSIINYRGRLIFPSVDGITNIDTSSLRFNVLTATRISDPIIDEISSIKTSLLPQIVGTAWANRVMMSVPGRGFNSNNEILVYDVTRTNGECWYVFDIASQWIGTISPPGSAGFVYIAQDNHFFRLDTMYVAQDETATGVTAPFPVQVTSGLIGSNTAHDGFFAIVQVVFYLVGFVGSVDLIVTWRDYQSGKMKSKTKTVTNGTYAKSSVGGWSSSGYEFNQSVPTKVLRWGETDVLTDGQSAQKQDQRFRVTLNNVVTNELQATIAVNLNNSAVIGRSVSFQGQPLGISPDVR